MSGLTREKRRSLILNENQMTNKNGKERAVNLSLNRKLKNLVLKSESTMSDTGRSDRRGIKRSSRDVQQNSTRRPVADQHNIPSTSQVNSSIKLI